MPLILLRDQSEIFLALLGLTQRRYHQDDETRFDDRSVQLRRFGILKSSSE